MHSSKEEEEKQINFFLNFSSKIHAVASQRGWGKGKKFLPKGRLKDFKDGNFVENTEIWKQYGIE